MAEQRAYDVSAQAKHVANLILQLQQRMELRKWAAEQAVKIVTAPMALTGESVVDVAKALTEFFHDFASKPANDALADLASVQAKPVNPEQV